MNNCTVGKIVLILFDSRPSMNWRLIRKHLHSNNVANPITVNNML